MNKYKPYLIGASLAVLLGAALLLLRKKVIAVTLRSLEWSNQPNFFTTSTGINLSALAKKVSITLSRNKGSQGSGYSEAKYKAVKSNPKVFWAIYDISNDTLLASSSNASKNVYGASVPKVVVASAALSNNNGSFKNESDYSKLIQLLVKSNNDVWTPIQNIAGGATAVNNWAKKMGYTMQPARTAGNNANAISMCQFFKDVCRNNFAGSEIIFKVTSSCQTSGARSRKYMPTSVYLGSKTGTYNSSNHDCGWIQVGDKFYAIAVLTELGNSGSEAIAQMWRGLYEEYVK